MVRKNIGRNIDVSKLVGKYTKEIEAKVKANKENRQMELDSRDLKSKHFYKRVIRLGRLILLLK